MSIYAVERHVFHSANGFASVVILMIYFPKRCTLMCIANDLPHQCLPGAGLSFVLLLLGTEFSHLYLALGPRCVSVTQISKPVSNIVSLITFITAQWEQDSSF
jgi:hypothetical protein